MIVFICPNCFEKFIDENIPDNEECTECGAKIELEYKEQKK